MQDENISQFFASLIKQPSLLKAGSSLIKQKITQQQTFLLDTIEYLSAQEEPTTEQLHQFFNIIVLIHPPLIETFPQLSEKTQEDVRGGLLNCVVALYQSLKCVSSIGLLIRQIIQIDSLEPWLESFAELLKWVASEDEEIVQAGLEFFIFLLKETQYNQANSDLPLYKMAGPLLQVLYQLFANSQLSVSRRQKLLFLVLQLVKTFSIYDGYNDEIVKQCFDPTFDIWMSFFVSTLQTSINTNIVIKKFIMKTIVVIFRDMQKYVGERQKAQVGRIYNIWEYCYRVLPLHLWTNIWEKSLDHYGERDNYQNQQDIPQQKLATEQFLYYDQDSQALLSTTESLSLTILQFISVITSIPQLNTTIKISIHHLTNVLFHYSLMSQSDSQKWQHNPQQFLSSYLTNQYQVTVRNKAVAILNQLIEKCGDYAIQAILMIGEKFLLNLPEEQTTESVKEILESVIDVGSLPELSSGVYESSEKLLSFVKLSSCNVRQTLHVSGETWRKMQTALVILGRFAEDIIVFQSKQQAAFDIQSFVKGLIKQVKDEQFYELLKGQSLYCLTRFTQIISIKYRHLFTQLCNASFFCILNDHPISIKAIACRALTLYLRKIQKHKIQFTKEDKTFIQDNNIVESILKIPFQSQVMNIVLQALIQFFKNKTLRELYFNNNHQDQMVAEYLLAVFHKNIVHQTTIQLFFGLLEEVCRNSVQYLTVSQIFSRFIEECLKSYNNILSSQEQIKFLKNTDLELIMIVLKISNVLIVKARQLKEKNQKEKKTLEKLLTLTPLLSNLLKNNTDIQIHIQTTICLKNLVKLPSQGIKNNKNILQSCTQSIKSLLKIPKDKSFESASIYAGNLTILSFALVFPKTNYEILQQAVLKVFRSRTPSVIQSLVLIYSRLINMNTDPNDPFKMNMQNEITDIVDFLSSFSIQNRMGLKILIDKWLLQQSLFRGKYTKISTFMALSKLFLLEDKRVDNLLVIGFNPSHTSVCNDVTAPLKILATLIRCLDNEKGFSKPSDLQGQSSGQQQNQFKEDNKVDVNLQKFKEEKNEQEQQQGGLADRQNQQGSTCYMSAMLEFYDDGEECDETTEEDLIFLKDSSTQFVLSDYLIEFFNYLLEHKKDYFKQCLKGILKSDVKTLGKYVKLD